MPKVNGRVIRNMGSCPCSLPCSSRPGYEHGVLSYRRCHGTISKVLSRLWDEFIYRGEGLGSYARYDGGESGEYVQSRVYWEGGDDGGCIGWCYGSCQGE